MKRALASAIVFISSCAPSDGVQVQLPVPQTIEQRNALLSFERLGGWVNGLVAPTDVTKMDCYLANAFGPDIASNNIGFGTGAGCSYQGVTSNLVTPANYQNISFKVPSGPARTIQMIGVQTNQGCTGLNTLNDVYAAYPQPTPSSTPSYQLYNLGSTTTDLYKDTQVTIKNTYTNGQGAGVSNNPFQCGLNGPATLPLVAAIGTLSQGSQANFDTSTLIPTPINFASFFDFITTTNVVTSVGLSNLSNPNNTTTYYGGTATTNRVGRVDLVFSLAGINLANYSSIEIKATVGGIHTAGAPVPGATIWVWNNSTSSFNTSGNLANTSNPPTFLDQTVSGLSPGQAATPISVFNSVYSGVGVNLSSNNNYLYVAVVNNTYITAGLELVEVNYLQVILNP